MPIYLKMLRRKIGVVTLVAATAILGVWFRSRTTYDEVGLATPWGFPIRILSEYRGIWLVQHESWTGQIRPQGIWYESTDTAKDPSDSQLSKSLLWHLIGVYFDRNDEQQVVYLQMSHWSIVIPLAVLSAWLLLSKPRPTKIKPIESPPDTEP